MAITDYRIEAWTMPTGGTFERVVANVPWTKMQFGREFNAIVQNQVELSAEFPRISEIIDPATGTELLLRCFKRDGYEVGNCIVRDGFREYRDNTPFVMAGSEISAEFNFSIIYPFDWVDENTEVIQPDWEWGSPNAFLGNPGLEDAQDGSTGWESGTLEGWQATPDSGVDWEAPDSLQVINDPSEARTGSFCVEINGDTYHSGMRKLFTAAKNSRITASVWINSHTTGKRITAGMTVGTGAVVHHTNGFIYSGIALAELGNVARNPAANGLPGGSTSGSYQKIDIDVTLGTNQTDFYFVVYYDHHDGSDGPIFYVDDFTISGGTFGMEPWEPRNSTMEIEDTFPIRNGDASLCVTTNGTGSYTDGIKQNEVDGLTIGVLYTLGFWVSQGTGSDQDLKATIQTLGGGTTLASGSAITVPDGLGTWTFVYIEWIATQETVQVSLVAQSSSSITFYMDDSSFAPGMVFTTLGDILQVLLADAIARGSLDWLKIDGFDAALDWDGVPWTNQAVSVRVNRGRTFKQTLDLLWDYGLEWRVAWDSGSGQYEFRAFDPGNIGTDKVTFDIGKLHAGNGFKRARILKSGPGAGIVLAEGDSFEFAEETDSNLVLDYGHREAYIGDTSYLKNADDVATQFLKLQWSRFEVRATIRDIDGQDVWDKYRIGDLFNVDLPPDVDEELRVWSMMLISSGDSSPETVVSLKRPQFVNPCACL